MPTLSDLHFSNNTKNRIIKRVQKDADDLERELVKVLSANDVDNYLIFRHSELAGTITYQAQVDTMRRWYREDKSVFQNAIKGIAMSYAIKRQPLMSTDEHLNKTSFQNVIDAFIWELPTICMGITIQGVHFGAHFYPTFDGNKSSENQMFQLGHELIHDEHFENLREFLVLSESYFYATITFTSEER